LNTPSCSTAAFAAVGHFLAGAALGVSG
jgi:hypothetical protein